MPSPREIIDKYRLILKNADFRLSFLVALAALILSNVANFFLATYATERASNPVTDIILSNIRTFDVDGVFVYGSAVLIVLVLLYCLIHPHKFPFIAKSISVFTVIRAVFISLTHIGVFPTQIPLDLGVITNKFIFGGDLFFSGHTGAPFLLALIFWEEKWPRYFFLFCSIFFGTTALLGHLHYTIDVLSAFFITYSIFRICEVFFKKDQQMFKSGV